MALSRFLLILSTLVISCSFLVACDSPEEKESKYINRGDIFFEKKDYIRARLEYRNAARISPANPEILYKLGIIDEIQGNIAGALKAFLVAEQQDPDFEPVVIKLSQFYLTVGQYDEVERRVSHILSLNPENADAHALKASLLLKGQKFDEAKKEVEVSLNIDPSNIIAFSVLTGMYIGLKDYDKALESVNRGIELNPDDLSLVLLKAAVYSEARDYKGVIDTYKTVFKMRPNDITMHFDLAEILSVEGYRKEAEEVLRNTVKQFPDNIVAKRKLSFAMEKWAGVSEAEKEIRSYIEKAPDQKILYLWLADLYIRSDLADKAIATLENVINTNIDDGISLNASTSLAGIKLNQGDAAFASRLIAEVLEKDVNNKDALFVRASLAFSQGDYQKSISDLRTIVRDNPKDIRAFRLLAEAFVVQGYIDLAIDTLQQSAEADPTNLKTYVRLAQLHSIIGDAERARELLSMVIRINPEYSVGLESMVRLSIEEKDWDSARKYIEKLSLLEGQESLSLFLRGKVKEGEGDKEAAFEIYKQVINKNPSSSLSKHALSSLLVVSEDLGKLPEISEYIASLDTKTATIPTVLGKLLLMLGKTQEAETAFKSAISRNPHTQMPYIYLAKLYVSRGDISKALELLLKADESIPAEASAAMMMADLFSKQGQIGKAIEIYDRLLQENSDFDAAANNMAQLIADYQSDDKEAMAKAKLAAERFITSDNPYYLDTLGWVYTRQGNYAQAKPILERALFLVDPVLPQMQYHYGYLLYKMGEQEKAIEVLEEAAKGNDKYPAYEGAKNLLSQIK